MSGVNHVRSRYPVGEEEGKTVGHRTRVHCSSDLGDNIVELR